MLLQIICRMPTPNVQIKAERIKQTFSIERIVFSKLAISLLNQHQKQFRKSETYNLNFKFIFPLCIAQCYYR